MRFSSKGSSTSNFTTGGGGAECGVESDRRLQESDDQTILPEDIQSRNPRTPSSAASPQLLHFDRLETALRPGYRHDDPAYLAMLQVAIFNHRYSPAEILVDEILAGACPPDLPLFNTAIRFCCSRRPLFSHAFNLYKRM
ncbi:hypothetical protein ZIOFF_069376 [Zingiber officinale]|uniref:Pentatricopeptide repeat-containing protein n=1 Tax=Zingiber officinale TaxID=94328 RepID=A0A8J5ERN3_ZINOF|nr:hypothetical protein ZIOFF_069376 [Zingiber officinale]